MKGNMLSTIKIKIGTEKGDTEKRALDGNNTRISSDDARFWEVFKAGRNGAKNHGR